MSFTDQKPRVATAKEAKAAWGGIPNGKKFKCYLCGEKFKIGDTWRWVYAQNMKTINFLTCKSCDGDDVRERFKTMYETRQRLPW